MMKMTKTILGGLAILALCAIQGRANSMTWVDADPLSFTVTPATPFTGGVFDIATSDGTAITLGSMPSFPTTEVSSIWGFRPGIDTALSGFFQFYVSATGTASKTVKVTVDGTDFAGGTFKKFFSPIGEASAELVLSINADGTATYRVDSVTGTFKLEGAVLTIDGYTPDGGSTLMLLGCALGAVGFATRMVRRQA